MERIIFGIRGDFARKLPKDNGIGSKIVAGYGIQISAGCGIGHKNHREIRDSNISREWDKVRKLFRLCEMVDFHLNVREIGKILTPKT